MIYYLFIFGYILKYKDEDKKEDKKKYPEDFIKHYTELIEFVSVDDIGENDIINNSNKLNKFFYYFAKQKFTYFYNDIKLKKVDS